MPNRHKHFTVQTLKCASNEERSRLSPRRKQLIFERAAYVFCNVWNRQCDPFYAVILPVCGVNWILNHPALLRGRSHVNMKYEQYWYLTSCSGSQTFLASCVALYYNVFSDHYSDLFQTNMSPPSSWGMRCKSATSHDFIMMIMIADKRIFCPKTHCQYSTKQS